MRYDFASDNTAGLCPEAREALFDSDAGFVASYGDDPWTQAASDGIRELFETECDVYFVFNGTAANSLSLATLCQSYQSIICHESAHVVTDECGAPEFFSNGSKLLLACGEHARIDPSEVERLATLRSDIHHPQPRGLSITQPTEKGAVYTVDMLAELGAVARAHELKIQMDGARFANAVASLGCAPKDITWEVGVDVLCFGGVKNGLALGEAVVFFDRDLSKEFAYRCKQGAQLASKMRYLSAPWARLLRDGTWLNNAEHANSMAQVLAGALGRMGVDLAHPVEANAVFAIFDESQRSALADGGWFLSNYPDGATRLMCSWATDQSNIDELISCLSSAER